MPEVDEPGFHLECLEELEPIEAAWRSLDETPELSIHQTYDWCRSWIAEKHATPLIITGTYAYGPNEGSIAFIVPLQKHKFGPYKFATYISAPFNNLNFGVFSPAFLRDSNQSVMQKIQQQIIALPLGVDFILLDRQPRHWRSVPHPFSYWHSVENQNHAFQIDLEGGFEQILGGGKAKRRRKKFRTSEKRLNEIGGYDYIIADTAEESEYLLEAFFHQKTKRFKKLGLPDVFCDAKTRSAFIRMATTSLDRDQKLLELHAIRLKEGDRSVCAVAALSYKGQHATCQFSSITDGPLESASPGELLFYLMIQNACDRGAQLFDFGIGDEQFKRSWCNITTIHYDTTIAVTTAGKLGASFARSQKHLKRFVKSHPVIFNIAKTIRLHFLHKSFSTGT